MPKGSGRLGDQPYTERGVRLSADAIPANAEEEAAAGRVIDALDAAGTALGRIPIDVEAASALIGEECDHSMSRAEAFVLASVVTQYVARGAFSIGDAAADSARLGDDAFDRVRGHAILQDLVRKGLVGAVPASEGHPPAHVATEAGTGALMLHAILAVKLDKARRGTANA